MDWDRQCVEYLPQVRATQTAADYYRVMMRFAASLRDGHAGIWPPKKLNDAFNSDPVLAAQGIRIGAEIASVDGQPVREYAESTVAPYVSSSTSQDRGYAPRHSGGRDGREKHRATVGLQTAGRLLRETMHQG